MIDARIHHRPGQAQRLILRALEVTGSQKELAARLGLTPRHIMRLKQGQSPMDYTLQVALEQISEAKPSSRPADAARAD